MIAPHLTKFLSEHHLARGKEFSTLLAELCEALESGSSCLPLEESSLKLPESLQYLACGEIGSVVGNPNSTQPLLLTPQNKLYFNRYYSYEKEIAQAILDRSKSSQSNLQPSQEAHLIELFPNISENDQAEAAKKSILQHFSIISGGPGTGKTTTVLKILDLLKRTGFYTKPEEVLLLAPTGKAADRLRQSLLQGLQKHDYDSSSFPTQTSTIHRALGYQPHSIHFKHNRDFPLSAKIVIVDETSMVDLPLMAKLFRAIHFESKIILLGDPHQLTSVEVGSLLTDLIEKHNDKTSCIHHTTTILRKSYRNQGIIHAVCESIKVGNSQQALQHIQISDETQQGHVSLQDLPSQAKESLSPFVKEHWLPALTQSDLSIQEQLLSVDRFRILSPTHRGAYGIDALNATVESILRSEGIDTSEKWYVGRSVIIQKNDHTLGIYNGDTGLCVLDKEGQTKVAFLSEDGVRLLTPTLLPDVKTAWALTIHRTQGSEYKELLLTLPELSEGNSLVTRELLYTGISRARNKANIWSAQDNFKDTINRKTQRASGLSDLL